MGHIKGEGPGQCQAFLHCVNLNKQRLASEEMLIVPPEIDPESQAAIDLRCMGPLAPQTHTHTLAHSPHNPHLYKLLLSSLAQHLLSNLLPCPSIYFTDDHGLPPVSTLQKKDRL